MDNKTNKPTKSAESISLEEAMNLELVKKLTDDSSFAIISVCRPKCSSEESFQRTAELKKEARKYGCHEYIGKWVEKTPEGKTDDSGETSLLITSISLKDAMKLGNKYEQSSIFYKDKNGIVEICTTAFTDREGNNHKPGDIVKTVHIDPKHPLNTEVASQIFSGKEAGPVPEFVKGGNKKEFQLHEKYLVSTWDGFTMIKINLSV